MVTCARKVKQRLRRKLKLLLGMFIVVSVIYQVVSITEPVLKNWQFWNHAPEWRDADFRSDLNNVNNKTEIIILRWTAWFGLYEEVKVLTGSMCPYLQLQSPTLLRHPGPAGSKSRALFNIPCRISFDRRYLEGSDALVFHSDDLSRDKTTPILRSKDHVWIYMQQECPGYTPLNLLRNYPNVFNWTMTYRRDSDVYHPYFQLFPVVDVETRKGKPTSHPSTSTNSTSDSNPNNWQLAKRPNLAAWVVSRCNSNSKREEFVKELQNYIPVGIFGKCGKACPAKWDSRPYLAKTYKFYLAFENSLCSDYITEKFFEALMSQMVPVVYGGQDPTDYSAIAPEGSYIDARKFSTARELADYLLYLDQNDEEYLKYFEWKAKFQVVKRPGWCNLCQKVFEHLQAAPESPSSSQVQKMTPKWYKDLWTWWFYLGYDEPRLEHGSSAAGHSTRSSYHYKRSACNMPV